MIADLKLRVVEVYASYQGEGPNTSRPTVFVRFAGCNFKCPGWPCDTQHAIDPSLFRKLQSFVTPNELAEQVLEFGIDNVCLTGGEVFLQNKNALLAFCRAVKGPNGNPQIECFTNGGLLWDDNVATLIDTFVLDWKLPGSGEVYETDALENNLRVLTLTDAVKFTIKDRNDYEIAKRRYSSGVIDTSRVGPLVYAGVVWDGAVTTDQLCAWMIEDKLPWRLNVQTHKFIWHPDKQGV